MIDVHQGRVFRSWKALVAVAAFSQFGKARRPGLLSSHTTSSSNRHLASACVPRGLAQHFTTGAFPSQAATGVGGGAGGSGPSALIEQMTQKVRDETYTCLLLIWFSQKFCKNETNTALFGNPTFNTADTRRVRG